VKSGSGRRALLAIGVLSAVKAVLMPVMVAVPSWRSELGYDFRLPEGSVVPLAALTAVVYLASGVAVVRGRPGGRWWVLSINAVAVAGGLRSTDTAIEAVMFGLSCTVIGLLGIAGLIALAARAGRHRQTAAGRPPPG
jgi:hypothetical protein